MDPRLVSVVTKVLVGLYTTGVDLRWRIRHRLHIF